MLKTLFALIFFALIANGCDVLINQSNIPFTTGAANTTYCFNENINISASQAAIIQNQFNTTINCQGFNLTGDGSSTQGIVVTGQMAKGINCNMLNVGKGIYVNGGNDGAFSNNSFTAITQNGIHLFSGKRNLVTNSTFNATANNHVCLDVVDENNNITFNKFYCDPPGDVVLELRSAGHYVAYNNFTSTIANDRAITSNTGNCIIIGNRINFVGRGISIYASGGYLIANNTISSTGSYGIYLESSSANDIIENNTIANGTFAIEGGSGINITQNSFGQLTAATSSSIISGNIGSRITLNSGTLNTISSNRLSDSLFIHSSNNTVLGNNFTSSVWINDTSGSNAYNNSSVGNIYNLANGSGASSFCSITSTTGTWADGGSDLPFSNSTSCLGGAYWFGQGADWHPWVGIAGGMGTTTANLSVLAINGTASGNQSDAAVATNYSISSLPENESYSFLNWVKQGNCSINSQAANTTILLNGNCNATARYYWNVPIVFSSSNNFTADYEHLGFGSITTTGGEDMGGADGVLLVLAIAWGILWLFALWLYETKRPVFAYCGYLAGYFAMFSALFVAIDTTSQTNPATSEFLQMFVFPMTWILVASILGFVIYIFLNKLVEIAALAKIKISNWWYDGKF